MLCENRSRLDDLFASALLPGKDLRGQEMDLKEEVRRRIAELTRSAYERGYRDGAQSALAEIENVAAEDLADQLQESPATLRALDQPDAPADGRRPAAGKLRKQPRKKADDGAPKAATVQRCIQELIAAKGEARRNEVLGAARAENPRITGQDVHNAVRTLARRGEIRVDPEESSRLLPPEAPSEPAPVAENDV